MNVQEKFATTRTELSACLIERESEVDLCLTGIIAGEHVNLIGMPGTAKSMLCDGITGWVNDGVMFEYIMTKYTTPEEIFGPVSLAGLKQDVYKRIVTGKLPEAHIAFLDEIWKASSAILNTLLKAINERKFANNGSVMNLPLITVVAASNEWPGEYEGGKELAAVFDRFLFRKRVNTIQTDEGLDRLLWEPAIKINLSTRITPSEIEQAKADAEMLPISTEAKEAFMTVLSKARSEGIFAGDRRLRKCVKAVKSFAWLNGATQVEKHHLEILSDCMWEDPAEQPEVLAKIVARIANPEKAKVNSLLVEADQVIKACNQHETAEVIASCEKLKEIHGKLDSMHGALAAKAAGHVKSQHSKLMIASIG